MKKFLENKTLWITLILIVTVSVGAYLWIGSTKLSPVERAMNKFVTAFQKYDIKAMKDMATDPDSQIFTLLETNKPLYKICAKNAEITIVNNSDYPIQVQEDKTASVNVKSINFNTYAFKNNIKEANGNKKKIKDAIDKVNTDRPQDSVFQLEKIDGKWKIRFEEMPIRKLLGDMNWWKDAQVTLNDDILNQLKDKLAKE